MINTAGNWLFIKVKLYRVSQELFCDLLQNKIFAILTLIIINIFTKFLPYPYLVVLP